MAPHINTPNEETTGTNGTRNGRGTAGCLTLIIHTPIHTSTKANKVPILVRDNTVLKFKNKAGIATKKPVRMVEKDGVPNLFGDVRARGGS